MKAIIHFFAGTDQSIESHYHQKEYRDDILIQIGDLYYEVFFHTPSTLQYSMNKDSFCSFPGLIIVEEIRYETIILALKYYLEIGYFDYFKGSISPNINSTFQHKIYRLESNWSEENLVSVPIVT